MRKSFLAIFAVAAIGVLVIGLSLVSDDYELEILPRESKLPEDAIRMKRESDDYRGEYEEPVPMPGPVNTYVGMMEQLDLHGKLGYRESEFG